VWGERVFVTTAVSSAHGDGTLLMATPAISAGLMFVRTQHHVFAVGN
jgi:hypothetical protein